MLGLARAHGHRGAADGRQHRRPAARPRLRHDGRPGQGGQQAAIGNFLTLLGITLIFATDLHHLAIAAIRDSYALAAAGRRPGVGDAATLAMQAVGAGLRARRADRRARSSSSASCSISGSACSSRLMPQLQVFFLALPATILVGMLVLLAVVGVMMGVFLDDLGDFLRRARRRR